MKHSISRSVGDIRAFDTIAKRLMEHKRCFYSQYLFDRISIKSTGCLFRSLQFVGEEDLEVARWYATNDFVDLNHPLTAQFQQI